MKSLGEFPLLKQSIKNIVTLFIYLIFILSYLKMILEGLNSDALMCSQELFAQMRKFFITSSLSNDQKYSSDEIYDETRVLNWK